MTYRQRTTALYSALLTLLLLSGCTQLTDAVTAPYEAADTAEQKAYALFGTYTIAQESAATLILNPDIPDQAKLAIQSADAVLTPLANEGVNLAMSVMEVRAQLNLGQTSADKLLIVADNLVAWADKFEPQLRSFQTIVNGAIQ